MRDFLEKALRIKEAHYGLEHVEVSSSLHNLGNAHGDLGDHSKMRDFLEKALRITEAHYGPEHVEVAITLNNLGNAHGNLGDHSKERDFLEKALRIFEAHYGPEHVEVAKALNNLAKAHDLPLARARLTRAVRILERSDLPASHPHAVLIRENLTRIEARLCRDESSDVSSCEEL
eukprot:2252235-Amphidinium_carterae.1